MVNKCSGCGKDFGGVHGFDLHRAGSYTSGTRHCLSDEQIVQKGLILSERGVWLTPTPNMVLVKGLATVSSDDEEEVA